MSTRPTPTPEAGSPRKYCERCSARLYRKRFAKRTESIGRFKARRFCGRACADAVSRHPPPRPASRYTSRRGRPTIYSHPTAIASVAMLLRRRVSREDIATRLGVTRAAVRALTSAARRAGHDVPYRRDNEYVTPELVERVVKLSETLDSPAIAEKLEMSVAQVYRLRNVARAQGHAVRKIRAGSQAHDRRQTDESAAWKRLEDAMQTACWRCGLRGEHVCSAGIDEVAAQRREAA